MDIRQLRQFLIVVEVGSLAGAARHLNISEPALSKSMRDLEKHLKVQLFIRHARGMSPTTVGVSLAEHARIVRSAMQHAQREIEELRGADKGHVIVGSGPSFANSILPRAVANLIASRPGVRVTVHEGGSDTLVPRVIAGDIDFVVVSMRHEERAQNLVQEPLLHRNDTAVIARVGHPLMGKLATLVSLSAQSWILPTRADPLRTEVESLFASAGLAPPRPTAESNSVLFIKSLLLASDCVAYLPRQLIVREEKQGDLAPLRTAGNFNRGMVGLVYRRIAARSEAARALMDEIRRLCRISRIAK